MFESLISPIKSCCILGTFGKFMHNCKNLCGGRKVREEQHPEILPSSSTGQTNNNTACCCAFNSSWAAEISREYFSSDRETLSVLMSVEWAVWFQAQEQRQAERLAIHPTRSHMPGKREKLWLSTSAWITSYPVQKNIHSFENTYSNTNRESRE